MRRFQLALVATILLLQPVARGQKIGTDLKLDHADQTEIVMEGDQFTWYWIGHVSFRTDSGYVYCDSAIFRKGVSVRLQGNVRIENNEYLLLADSTYYNILTGETVSRGRRVELWAYKDSLYAVGSHAFYDDANKLFYMEERPVLYINYPDTARMVEIIADVIEYNGTARQAEALGDVKISSRELNAAGGCAVINLETRDLDLFDQPTAASGKSEVSGELILISFQNGLIDEIDVIDSARGEFRQPIDSAETDFDRSVMTGQRLIFDFHEGILNRITCYGQAYSWYYPSSRGGREIHENTVSGDTIKLAVLDDGINSVTVIGGAVGTYTSEKLPRADDTAGVSKIDTVDYSARHLVYNLRDSLITLNQSATVRSGTVSLMAHSILFDTRRQIIEAFSASIESDGETIDTLPTMNDRLQPDDIPVVLRDKSEEIYGDYLEYSIDTEKGRIIQSKSEYDEGLYYGDRLFREQKDIFYVDEGRYTTCDATEPHYQFHSSNMKLIEGDKLIARPVIFYIERLPIFILPYYVFPLKRGRHSGLLPFTFGKFHRGDRFVKNVGYYWAASEYVDFKSAMDYHEKNQTVTFRGSMNFNKRYALNGNISGDYARETNYNATVADENVRTRWIARGNYNHDISPTFKIRASGDFQSDRSYFTDFSQNLDERLNRQTKSRASFTKKFGKSISLSGDVSHTVDLDAESRTDLLPQLSLSLPTLWVFGSGSRDEEGKLDQKWYQKTTFRYSPRMSNFSSRVTLIETDTTFGDTGQFVSLDTTKTRSRKKYTKISHNPALNLPSFKLFQYISIVPRVSYSETWFKIRETDQSLDAGVDATTYRTYSYNAGVSMRTALYGTVRPNFWGLTGLRQVLTPTVSYRWAPDIDRHPESRSFAGGGAGSRKQSVVSFNLSQLYQAKIKSGENERKLNLLSTTSGFSYNYEAEERPWSNMNTSFQSSLLGKVSLSGNMSHSFYLPGTNELHFFSPFLLNFNLSARFTLSGRNFLFNEPVGGTREDTTTADGLRPREGAYVADSDGSGWSLSASFSHTESGRGQSYVKRRFVTANLGFNLTPATRVAYSQSYDFNKGATVHNSVSIVRKIHCWTGSLFWVPIGSNRGFGFKLFVTLLPEIKVDSNHDSFLKGLSR